MNLGDRLRRAGLTQQGLLAWAGAYRLTDLWEQLLALMYRPVTPAAVPLSLFVGGADISIARARMLPIDDLVAAGLVEVVDDKVQALVSVLPLEQTFVVADRFDAEHVRDRVCWPDDSSYHLASAIAPGRRTRWLDLACGSAFAPMMRPGLATAIHGVDLNPRAVRYARLGAQLAGVAHFSAHEADIGAVTERAPLVTVNAPILGDSDAPIWRATDQGFFDRLWTQARTCVEDGGEMIVHSVLVGVPDALPGEVATVVYTPPGERAFCVTWWRPDAANRRALGYRELTAARPHLDPSDRDAVLAGALPPHVATPV